MGANTRTLLDENATDFLKRSLDSAHQIADGFDPDEGAEVRVEVRVTVDNGSSYAKMPWSGTAYVIGGEWHPTRESAME